MKFPALVLSSICGVAGVAVASPALAHILLTAPTPRVPNNDSLKTTPCGGDDYFRSSARVNMAKPGDMITVEWEETVSHPGYFRIMFDEDGQDGLEKPTAPSFKLYSDYYNGERNNTTVDKLPKLVMGPVKEVGGWTLLDNWGLHPSGPRKKYSVKVTLPNVTCDNCTLQVVQGMYESSRTYDNAYYYHCADFVLKGTVATDAGTTPSPDAGVAMGGSGGGGQAGQIAGGQGGKASGGSAGSAGKSGNNDQGGEGGETASAGGGGGDAENSDKSRGGGCSFGGRSTSAFSGLMLMLVAVASLLRRRRMPM